MEEKKDFNITKGLRTKNCLERSARSAEMVVENEAVDKLITEGGEDFYNYFTSLGLSEDPNLIVLSSMHHYYYDSDEMKKAKTIVNLKELNQIKEIKNLLHLYFLYLPFKCNFIGYFRNNAKVKMYSLRNSSSFHVNRKRSDDIENDIISRFPFINMLYGFMDSKTNTFMTELSVRSLLNDNGFKLIDMKELNGFTYFHSQNLGHINY